MEVNCHCSRFVPDKVAKELAPELPKAGGVVEWHRQNMTDEALNAALTGLDSNGDAQ